MDTPTSTAASSDTAFFGHPRGLAVLFFAEMWERFSYYGMRALLVTYLVWHFLQAQDKAYGIYAAYAGMVYLAPLLGGYLADRYLGARKAVTFGAVLITLGHFAMAYEGAPGTETLITDEGRVAVERINNPDGAAPQFVRQVTVGDETYRVVSIVPIEGSDATVLTYQAGAETTADLTGRLETRRDPTGQNMMFLALALIIIGTGFLKANISTIVGALYETGDKRRDSGFTIFYLGINLGAFVGQLTVAYLGIAYGWAYGFGLAGIGMVAGLIIFVIGSPWLDGRAEPPSPQELRAPVFGPLSREWVIYLSGLFAVGLAFLSVKYLGQFGVADILRSMGVAPEAVPIIGSFTIFDLAVNTVFIGAFLGIVWFSLAKLEKVERERMIALLALTLSSVIFWMLFDQAPISLVIFQSQFVDTMGFNAQQIGALNPLFILIFAPIFTIIWQGLGRRGREPASPLKFAFGLAQIGLGFLVLSLGISVSGDALVIPLIWVALMYLLHTTGELCLSPIGLSAVTKLSVPRLVGFMMGMWFMATALSQVLASIVSKATVVPPGTAPVDALAQFNTVYFWLGVASIGTGVVMAMVSPKLRAMMHGAD